MADRNLKKLMNIDLKFKEFQITNISQFELEKIINVNMLRHQTGISQCELSFLIGQRTYHIRDCENLNNTLTYSIPQNNLFRQIFDCGIEPIVPDMNKIPKYSARISFATDEIEKIKIIKGKEKTEICGGVGKFRNH